MLIPASQLNQIARQVGPKDDEGLFRILAPSAATTHGAGFTRPGLATVATVAGRITHLMHMSDTEKMQMGLPRVDADFLISLEAFTHLDNKYVLRRVGLAWTAETLFRRGSVAMPSEEDGRLYLATVGGTTDSTEPDWETDRGEETTDGSITWQCLGLLPEYQIVQILGSSTYGDYISKKVLCKLRQL